jgi:uncharacterized membrane protein YphA (DoxX/SURF4 family)
MKGFMIAGRWFFALGLVGIAIQQIFYPEFCPILLPGWFSGLPGLVIWIYLSSILLIGSCLGILFEKKARLVALILGGILLLLFCFVQVPYEIIADPNSHHLALWTNALKELALSGGAFTIAGSFSDSSLRVQKGISVIGFMGKIIPFGRIFFSITMIAFGIEHFLYTVPVSTLVPAWIPYPLFWTYFSAIALIGSGVAIILKLKLRAIGILLGSMILFWLIILHIPRAIADPSGNKGGEILGALSALAFSGIAFVLAVGNDLTLQNRFQKLP